MSRSGLLIKLERPRCDTVIVNRIYISCIGIWRFPDLLLLAQRCKSMSFRRLCQVVSTTSVYKRDPWFLLLTFILWRSVSLLAGILACIHACMHASVYVTMFYIYTVTLYAFAVQRSVLFIIVSAISTVT